MRKFWGIVLLGVCFASAEHFAEAREAAPAKKVRILCSTFPAWLFTRNVTSGSLAVQADLMLPAAMGCPHDYVLAPQDMKKIAKADALVINGLGLENFIGAPLRKANSKIAVIDASRGITPMMLTPEGDEQGHGHNESIGLQDKDRKAAAPRASSPESPPPLHSGANPHLFASPRMAALMVSNIAAQLSKLNPAEAALYEKNAAAYAARLTRLSDEFSSASQRLHARRVMTVHAVFDYLARDAGLEIAAVIEETPGQEPSAAGMLRLIKIIKDSKVAAVFTEPQYPDRTARTIAREAGAPVAVLDPVASGPENAPLEYYETVMRRNIEILIKTLGEKGR